MNIYNKGKQMGKIALQLSKLFYKDRKNSELSREICDYFKMSRKRSLAQSSPNKRIKTSLFDPNSQFLTILKSCGLSYFADDDSFILHKDQSSFAQSLSSFLEKKEDNPTQFTQYVSSLCKNNDCLVKLLAPIKYTEPSLGFSMEVSLIRLLLEDCKLYPHLLEVIGELIYSISNGIRNFSVDMDIPNLLLMQLRWLPSSSGYCDDTLKILLDLIDISSVNIRRDIILILPDILFKDSHALKTVEKLKQLLFTNPELAPCILEALSNLCIPQNLLIEIQDIALNLLKSTEIGATPMLIKFLFQTIDKDRRISIIPELRIGLDFNAYSVHVGDTSDSSKSTAGAADESLDLIVADILRISFVFQKELEVDWIKMLERLERPDRHNFSDFVVLLILLDIANDRRPAVNLFKNKIRSNCFNEDIISNFFTNHHQIAKRYFNSILQLCESLLSCKETKLNNFGSLILESSFNTIETSLQQELIVLLVTLINMKSTLEADLALRTLLAITVKHPDSVATFEIFITNLIDGMEQMSTSQIRLLYSILSCLAFRTSTKLRIQNELLILLKKQLSSTQSVFKCIGVIGAITAIEYLMSSPLVDISAFSSSSQLTASQSLPSASSSSSSSSHITSSGVKAVVNLLHIIRNNYTKSPEVGSLYMDELGRSLARGTMDSQIEEWVSDKILQNFQDDFVCSNSEAEKSLTQYYLDDSSVCDVAINIGPLWSQFNKAHHHKFTHSHSNPNSSKRLVSPACLSSHFRLLVLCEHKQRGNLTDVDALLSCPILLDSDSLDPVPTLLSINWIIEVINAFSTQQSMEMKKRVLLRLKNLIKLRAKLQDQLANAPDTPLPIAAYESGISTIKLPMKSSEKKSKPKKIVKAKAKTSKSKQTKILTTKNREVNSPAHESLTLVPETQPQSCTSQLSTTNNNREKQIKPSGLNPNDVNLDSIANVFREFDLDVAKLLSIECLEMSSESGSPSSLSLDQPEIHLLIEDLTNKARHVFPTSCFGSFVGSKQSKLLTDARFRNLDNHTKPALAEKFIDLIPSLCKHLETTAEYFKVDANISNDSIDEVSQENSQTQLIDVESAVGKCHCSIMSNILDIFHHLIKWLFESKESSPALLKKALRCFATKIDQANKTKGSSSTGYTVVTKKCIQYLQQLIPHKICHIHAALVLSKIIYLLKQNLDNNDDSISRPSTVADSEEMDIHSMTQLLLNREWNEDLKWQGHRYKESLQNLVNLHFKSSPSPLNFLKSFIENELAKVSIESTTRSTTYLQLSTKNFPVFYKQSLDCLSAFCKTIRSKGTIASERDRQKQFDCWLQCFSMLSTFSDMLRENADRFLLTAFLKYGTIIIQILIKDTMPLLDAMFKTNSNPVMFFLKSVQRVTRFMQHVCAHGKTHQQSILAKEIPKAKLCLENFIYRVKIMVSQNQCLQGFWFGNLKNKTLHGEVIESDEDIDLSEHNQDSPDDNNQSNSDQEAQSHVSDGSESC